MRNLAFYTYDEFRVLFIPLTVARNGKNDIITMKLE